ncbi:MAG: helix-turn-helix domain-containing protein [Lachnospiraceae bacterium]|nr:helix-turn-helix domain-containing protein [Lachnospiraceae bacterium]
MDATKTAKFIYELRQEKGLTQKELADRIGVSDKAVSKWENARGLPDISSIETLCAVFDISINELLCGQKLSSATYEANAEENIKALIKDNTKKKLPNIFLSGLGFFLIVLSITFMIILTSEVPCHINNLIDIPSILYLILVETGFILINGVKSMNRILYLIRSSIIPLGFLYTLLAVIILLTSKPPLEVFLLNLPVSLLPTVYSTIVYLITLLLIKRKPSKTTRQHN